MHANPESFSGILGLAPPRRTGVRAGTVGMMARWLRRWRRPTDRYWAPRRGWPEGGGGPEAPDDGRLATESPFDDPAFWLWIMH
jgi:hypothetical protein